MSPPPEGVYGPPLSEGYVMDDGTPGPVLVTKLPRRVSNPFWARVLDNMARFFSRMCHSVGAVFLRGLSTLVLVAGIVGAVMLQLLGFYYMGVLNPNPLIACLLYVPTLAAIGLVREEVLKNGTSPSGVGAARDSHAVAIAYMVMIVSGFLNVLHPVWLRGENFISAGSMWTCIGGTAWFYFALLFSSLAYASALNIYRSDAMDRRIREMEAQGYAVPPYGLPPYGAGAYVASPRATSSRPAPSTPLAGPPSEAGSFASAALEPPVDPADPYSQENIDAAKPLDGSALPNAYE